MRKTFICLILAVIMIPSFICSAAGSASVTDADQTGMRDEAVIVPVSISLVSAGRMLDFRYRVTDEDKARTLLTHKIKPALIVESDGTRSAVVTSPKVGALRTTRPHQKEKLYFMLFGNPGMKLKKGDKVSVVIGDFKAEHLTVQ